MDLAKKRWYVLIASVVINLCIGSGYAWSVFAGPLIKILGCTAAAAAVAFSLTNMLGPVTMITGGWVQDKFGPKWVIFAGAFMFGGGMYLAGSTDSLSWLYMTYGIMGGLGMGMVYGCTIANTVKFFPDRRGLVAGLATAGYGFGPVIAAPLAQSLIASYGVLATLKIMGIGYLIIIAALSMLITAAPVGYKPEGWNPPAPTASSTVTGAEKNWSQMLSDPMFYLLFSMLVIGAFSGLMIISQASPIAQEIVKVTAAQAAMAVSYLALSNTFGRIFWGSISDKFGRFPALIAMYILAAVAAYGLTTISAGAFTPFVVIVMVIGLCFGGFMGIFPALTADTFGAKNNGVNYGIMFCAFAVAGWFGPRTAATVKAANNGDYTQAFVIAGILSVIGIALTLIVVAKNKKAQAAKNIAG
ncbi:MAG: NarK [Firmicutes bacterium]|nr:NarK [Bacillota bacterium]